MKAKLVALCAAVAVIALTASGATAVSDSELAPDNETNNTAVGICVVGVDSPCNGDDADESLGDELRGDDANETDSGDRKMWIPEDQNRDGEIDDRFGGVPEFLDRLFTGLFGLN